MHGCRFVTHYAAVPSSNCAPTGKGKNMLCIAGKKKRTMQAFVTCGPCVILALTDGNARDHCSLFSLVSINRDVKFPFILAHTLQTL